MRVGKHVSRSIESLVDEAKNLVSGGVKEIMLIAQELTYYGLDIYKKRELPRLLHALADIPGLEWIRLHYAYPSKFPMEIIDAMKERENICNYLDMPLQHASNKMLKAMKRQITREEMEDIIGEIKYKIPGICLRTTLIAGFLRRRRMMLKLKLFAENRNLIALASSLIRMKKILLLMI